MNKWSSFIKELSNLIFFWLSGIIFFFLFRLTFILIFYKDLGSAVKFTGYLKAFHMGFRFDCMVLGYFLILPFAMLLIFSGLGKFNVIRVSRRSIQILLLVLSSFICVVALNYYKEYRAQFNNFVFLGLHDDQVAIWKTIMVYYHPVWNFLAVAGVFLISFFTLRYFEHKTTIYNWLIRIRSKWTKAVLVVLCLFLFMSSLRGAFTGPTLRRKWAAVAGDSFLNKTIINPFRSLLYAYEDFSEESPFGNKNLQLIFEKDSISQVLEKTAKGSAVEQPKQIFLIIMESYDSWPLMDKYTPFGFSESLSRIASEGAYFTNFLPAHNASIHAYNTILTGIPYCGVQVNHLGTTGGSYMTSLLYQFKKLGYTTNFFYGGFLSWQNIGDFTSSQGSDRVYSAEDMEGDAESGDWGVEDEVLFDFILRHLDPDEYSFNLVFTSSYHTPYTVDVYAEGFPYRSEDDFPAEVRGYYDGGMTMEELGHLWYGDKELGRFVEQAEQVFENALYSFTGDHYGRKFINYHPNLYERSSVPFIVYGKGIPAGRRTTPGDHADIIPTLIELVAPEGFKYYSFGSSLFDESKDLGIGYEKTIDFDSLFYFPKEAPVDKFSLVDGGSDIDSKNRNKEVHDKRLMLSWHYLMRGEFLGKKEGE